MSMTCWLMRRTTSLFAGSSCSIGCVPGNAFAMRVALGLTVYAEQVSGVTTAGSDPEYIRFASKITLTVGGHGCLCCALLPVTVASGPQIPTQLQETARIRPPVLTIEYADRQVASFATDSSFYAASVEFTVRFRLTAPCASAMGSLLLGWLLRCNTRPISPTSGRRLSCCYPWPWLWWS